MMSARTELLRCLKLWDGDIRYLNIELKNGERGLLITAHDGGVIIRAVDGKTANLYRNVKEPELTRQLRWLSTGEYLS